MSSTGTRPLLLDDERGTQSQRAWVASLRFFLRVINLLLVLTGCAIMAYAAYMYYDVRHQETLHGFPWFIFAFGGGGAFILLTATTALVGVAHNSGFCLGLYSFLMVVLLIGQAVLAVAFFADDSWKKLLPHDESGQAQKMAKFLQHKLTIVRWVGLGVLIVQVSSVMLAYALSAAQQRLLGEASDEEDEVWGRREALPRTQRSTSSALERGEGSGASRQDLWSQRMRSKYGLDVDAFSYDPSRAVQSSQQAPVLPVPAAANSARTGRCSIM